MRLQSVLKDGAPSPPLAHNTQWRNIGLSRYFCPRMFLGNSGVLSLSHVSVKYASYTVGCHGTEGGLGSYHELWIQVQTECRGVMFLLLQVLEASGRQD